MILNKPSVYFFMFASADESQVYEKDSPYSEWFLMYGSALSSTAHSGQSRLTLGTRKHLNPACNGEPLDACMQEEQNHSRATFNNGLNF